jgi:hypothetical protein
VLVSAAILIAGWLPGGFDPINLVHWSGGTGLRFESPSQVLSERPLWLHGGEFTLEVWLAPDAPPSVGNREILSFVDGPGVSPLLLGQWPKGFFLRSRVHNPKGRPSQDRYGRFAIATTVHLAVLGRGQEAMLFVDGEPTQVSVSMPESPFGGRLLLGSSASGFRPWLGELQAVAIYDRAIEAEEIQRHAALSPFGRGIDATATGGPVAFYAFDQPGGVRIESQRDGAPTLLLPERVSKPSPPILRFMFSGKNWFHRDVALNLLGFLPLGLVIAWQRGRSAVLVALAAGLVLSLSVELAQVLIPGRHSSAFDLISNTLGAGLGAVLAIVLGPRALTDADGADSTG